MPVRAAIILLFAATAIMGSGCGTVATIKHPCYQEDRIVYGGTRWDSEAVREGIQNRDVLLSTVAFDVPFSLVADTVALPYTISYSLWHRLTLKKMQPVEFINIEPK